MPVAYIPGATFINHRSTLRNPAGQRAIPPATRNGDRTGPGNKTPAVPRMIRRTPISGGNRWSRTGVSGCSSAFVGGWSGRARDPPGPSGYRLLSMQRPAKLPYSDLPIRPYSTSSKLHVPGHKKAGDRIAHIPGELPGMPIELNAGRFPFHGAAAEIGLSPGDGMKRSPARLAPSHSSRGPQEPIVIHLNDKDPCALVIKRARP